MIIYKAENKINGKIYIGQTKNDLNHRIALHLKAKSYIGKAFRKYGFQSFIISVVDEAASKETLNEKEIYWIKFYGCQAPNGYNLTSGGGGLNNPSQVTREKISKALRGKPSGRLGQRWSEEHKINHSLKLKGRHPTEETKENIRLTLSRPDVILKMRKPKAEAHKKAISAYMIEKCKDPEYKTSLSPFPQGHTPWNKGIKTGHVPWNKGLTKKDYPKT